MKTWLLLAALALGLALAPRRAATQVLPGTFSAGLYHSLSIHADGTLWATGLNTFGQLGTGTTTASTSWTQVGTASNWVQVAAGYYHSLALQADGSLWAWGINQYGQLGNAANSGIRTANPTPVRVGTDVYTQLAAGGIHSLALKADGSLWAWGSNDYGQLGIALNSGTATANPMPNQVGTARYTQLAAGGDFSLALRPDGTVWAWGDNALGQLGNATNNGAFVPNPLPTQVGPEAYTQVAAGYRFSLALRADGSAWGWGSNYDGELGNATNAGVFMANPTPTQVSTGVYTQLAAGSDHSLGRQADGTVWAWGSNTHGQLGTALNAGTDAPNPTPTLVGTLAYGRVAAGSDYSLALRADGSLWAWGYNGPGQLGTGTRTDQPAPVATGTALPTRSTAAATYFGLAVRADGTLWAWGNNDAGQLGDGTTTASLLPKQAGPDRDWVQVAAGNGHSLGLKADGSLWAWGDNDLGQLGVALNSGIHTANPTPVRVGTAVYTQVVAGVGHTLALRADGTVWAWGSNYRGQLGTTTNVGSSNPNPTPTQVSAAAYTQLAAGTYHSLGLQADGTAWAWGGNTDGQLGNPTNSGTSTPNFVPARIGPEAYTQLAAGNYHSLALRADGTLWAWGNNYYGQLGTAANVGTGTANPAPAQVGTASYTRLAAGSYHSLALQADGSLWVWGCNGLGQLGDGTNHSSATPTRVGTALYTQVAAGGNFTLALQAGGSLWAWGDNQQGELGTTSTTNSPAAAYSPVRIGSATYVQVAAGNSHSLGLQADGTLLSWGENGLGQLGNGATSSVYTPTATSTALPTRSTAAGGNFGLAVRADGTLWAWGDNSFGQLGTGNTTASLPPHQVGSARDWVQVAAGLRHSLALKADGSLWAWGSNSHGQLGTAANAGTSTPTTIPTQVGTARYTQVAAGGSHSLALQADGTAWAWGFNQHGQLGTAANAGTSTPTPTPTPLGPDLYVQLTAGQEHSLGRRPDGTLWAWGFNQYGQLGTGSTSGGPVPAPVVAGRYVQVAAGGAHTVARRADGTVWAWGSNSSGQLGNATNYDTFAATPTPVPVGTARYTQVAAGELHSLALQADGTLWAWGNNGYGQLGSGQGSSLATPTPTREIAAGTAWTTLATGPAAYASLARTASGLGFASAGYNASGQLGDGTTTDWPRFDRPVPLGTLHLLPTLAAATPAALRLFPNPAQGHAATLAGIAPGTAVRVLDALGRPVLAATADATGTARLLLPAPLAPGVYLVQAGGQVRRLAVE